MARLQVLELFCGIGGCAAAIDGRADVVAAIDVNRKALAVYQHNFRHPIVPRTIESFRQQDLASWPADLWWLSPPCQPYTTRGRQRDIDDPRAASLLTLIELLPDLRPRYLTLENVPGFAVSRASNRLRTALQANGYNVQEILLCPTELGVPNRRSRFYLVAAQGELLPWPNRGVFQKKPLAAFLQPSVSAQLLVPPRLSEQYTGATHQADPADPQAIAHCFTAAYGRSMTKCGSYLHVADSCRRFSPEEQLRLLGFPTTYSLPRYSHPREMWPLVGNSLSVVATRYVLSTVPELADLV